MYPNKLKLSYIWPFLLLIAANGLIIAHAAPGLRYIAALALPAFLPGWVWLQVFFTLPANIAERITLAIGLSLALTVLGALFAVYLPGPINSRQLLIVTNVIVIAGLITTWGQKWLRTPTSAARSGPRSRQTYPRSTAKISPTLLSLVLLLLLAVALRLPRLGYAEFHEDEAEAMMLGVRLLQGEDYALFLHRKGPAQMLVPVTFWLLTGQITEFLARFPFALSSVLSVAAIFFIGQRWFNWRVGAAAALLWAVNGYAVGFGRMVQYQALIFFLGPLAIYFLYLAWKYRQPHLQIVAAVLLAVCSLAHFDALLLLPTAAYLVWLIMTARDEEIGRWGDGKTDSRGVEQQSSNGKFSSASLPPNSPSFHRSRFFWTAASLVIFAVLLASFYIPYLLDPEFNNTVTYLSGTRVKPGALYNNLKLLWNMDKSYSSHFYLPLLALGIISFIGYQKGLVMKRRAGKRIGGARRRSVSNIASSLLLSGLVLWLISTLWLPNLWTAGRFSLAVLPWLVLGFICFRLFSQVEAKIAWIMAGSVFIGYTFLVEDPRSHFYIMYPGLVLLAGVGWVALVERLAKPMGQMALSFNLPRLTILTIVIFLISAIITYEVVIFLQPESTLTRIRSAWDGSGWEVVYDDLPKAREYFGYPKREGWKAIGALRAQGRFPGDFRSMDEDFIIPIWYTYGQARSCYTTPAHFFIRDSGDDRPGAAGQYAEVGRVQRENEVRLRIFSAGANPEVSPVIYPLEAYVDIFDRLAIPQQFAQQAEPAQFVGSQFGPAIRFVGYDLPQPTITPGDTLYINLYWQALDSPGNNYRAFVHLTDGNTLWGQQDDTPACRLPTSIWRAGQRSVGQFRLPIDPQTPPGRYPLVIGLYQADTLERLKITAGAGQTGDDFLWLTDIEVVEPATQEQYTER